jgi:hypothetical protein
MAIWSTSRLHWDTDLQAMKGWLSGGPTCLPSSWSDGRSFKSGSSRNMGSLYWIFCANIYAIATVNAYERYAELASRNDNLPFLPSYLVTSKVTPSHNLLIGQGQLPCTKTARQPLYVTPCKNQVTTSRSSYNPDNKSTHFQSLSIPSQSHTLSPAFSHPARVPLPHILRPLNKPSPCPRAPSPHSPNTDKIIPPRVVK